MGRRDWHAEACAVREQIAARPEMLLALSKEQRDRFHHDVATSLGERRCSADRCLSLQAYEFWLLCHCLETRPKLPPEPPTFETEWRWRGLVHQGVETLCDNHALLLGEMLGVWTRPPRRTLRGVLKALAANRKVKRPAHAVVGAPSSGRSRVQRSRT